MGPGDLEAILSSLPLPSSPELLVGVETCDDAAIYKLSEDTALVQTLDFFTPISDSPKIFGEIAAANALSDVYAMGGRPITALNILCFPSTEDDKALAEGILKGAHKKCQQANCLVVGGHTVEDDTVKFGLSVSGLVDPKSFWPNSGACPGDCLILTKPIGTGIVLTALLAELDEQDHRDICYASMARLNDKAVEIARAEGFRINGATDITGFGLLGHACEMARASNVELKLRQAEIPLLPGVLDYASMGLVPAGAMRNRENFHEQVDLPKELSPEYRDVLFDAQTSGGLLLSLAEKESENFLSFLHQRGDKEARIIGRVKSGPAKVAIDDGD